MTDTAGQRNLRDLIKCAGVNIGYGNTKVRTDGGYFQYISDVNRTRSRKSREDFGADAENTQLVHYSGNQYEVGDGAGLLSAPRARKPIFPNWAGTEPYMVLRQSVLDRLAKEGSNWIVTLGVPNNEMLNDEYTTKVRQLWLGEHETAHGPIRILSVQVAAEPSGALFYYGTTVVDMETLKQQNLTILDFGYFTTLGTTHHRLHADMDNTIQIERGVSRVAEHITAAIHKRFSDDRDVVEVERAMLGRLAIRIDGEPVNIEPLLLAAVGDVGASIVNEVRTRMPKPASRMYLVGGGAHPRMFGDLVRAAYPDARVDISDRPQEANAYGLHRLTLHKLQQLHRAGKLEELWHQSALQHAA